MLTQKWCYAYSYFKVRRPGIFYYRIGYSKLSRHDTDFTRSVAVYIGVSIIQIIIFKELPTLRRLSK